MGWEPPFEDDLTRGTMDALVEINAKLAVREHVAVIRDLLEEDENGEEEEED